jgi:hypothetical protein
MDTGTQMKSSSLSLDPALDITAQLSRRLQPIDNVLPSRAFGSVSSPPSRSRCDIGE